VELEDGLKGRKVCAMLALKAVNAWNGKLENLKLFYQAGDAHHHTDLEPCQRIGLWCR
jgi:hypothetical protein